MSPTDRLLVTELYAMCTWPDVPAPPATAITFPVTYAFIAMRIGLKRSGAERAVERLRERGWISTELDEASGYLIYTVHVGKILQDLEAWGRWSVIDALGGRAPSRRGRPGRSQRWGRAPRPPHLRQRPQAMPITDLVSRWRCIWPDAPDPTTTLAALMQDGAKPKQLHRALDSLESSGLASPRPSFIRDRYVRLAYREPGGDPEPVGGDPEPDGRDPELAGGDPEPVGGDPEPAGAGPEPADADPEPAGGSPELAGLAWPAVVLPSASPGAGWSGRQPSKAGSGTVDHALRADERERSRLSERLRRGFEALVRGASSRPKARPPDTEGAVSPRNRNESWTSTDCGSTTAAGRQARAHATAPKTSHPPDREGEL